jgi:arginase
MRRNISILGMPMNGGQPKEGTDLGPKALRDAGIAEELQKKGYNVTDLGDEELEVLTKENSNPNLLNLTYVSESCEKLCQEIQKIDLSQEFPFILGGDHSMAIGTLAGIASNHKNLGVIWFDAHTDLNTEHTTGSGNIHGMSLAASLGLGHELLTNVGGYKGKVKIENVVIIAARDIDPGEADLIKDKGIKTYTIEDVNNMGMQAVTEEALKYLSHCDGIHLSYDVDSLDPSLTPGTGTAVPNGVNISDAIAFLTMLKEADVVTSLELVEVNPNLEEAGNGTAVKAVEVILHLF